MKTEEKRKKARRLRYVCPVCKGSGKSKEDNKKCKFCEDGYIYE